MRAWPLSDPGAGKESRGHLVVLGGSRTTPGAAQLAGEAALRAGAGKLELATSASAAATLAVAVPEARVLDLPEDETGAVVPTAADRVVASAEDADALLVGPGFDDVDVAVALLAAVLPRVSCPLVVDALGTAYLTEEPDGVQHLDGRVVVTANPVELAKLTGQDEVDGEDEILDAALEVARTRSAVVLAGAEQKLVVAPDGRSWVVQGGGVGLGVSGSGDVQAGIVAGLLARGEEPARAAVWGAYLHARAGERLAGEMGPLGYLARELPPALPAVLNELR
nr:NAD(P)H-hydrate dehydratase [Nocardioides sp. MAH-18]